MFDSEQVGESKYGAIGCLKQQSLRNLLLENRKSRNKDTVLYMTICIDLVWKGIKLSEKWQKC